MTEEELVEILKKGGIVAFPTDTVYGFIAIPTEDNLNKIYNLKGRERKKPIGLFLSSADLLVDMLSIDFDLVKEMIGFWPGALTLVLPVKESVYPFLQKNGKIGFRIPDSPILLDVLDKTGPLIQTSANLSGEPPCVTTSEVKSVFKEDVIVFEGRAGNLASTVLDYDNGRWHVLRKGHIPIVEIREKTGAQITVDSFNLLFMCTGNIERSPMAQAIARELFKGFPVNIRSRGIYPGGRPYSGIAQSIVKKLGYPPLDGRSVMISEEDLKWADLVLVMEKRHVEFIKENYESFSKKVYLLSDSEIPDPIGLGEKTHELVARIIESALKKRWLDYILSFLKQKRG